MREKRKMSVKEPCQKADSSTRVIARTLRVVNVNAIDSTRASSA